jgi:hypothetical protein
MNSKEILIEKRAEFERYKFGHKEVYERIKKYESELVDIESQVDLIQNTLTARDFMTEKCNGKTPEQMILHDELLSPIWVVELLDEYANQSGIICTSETMKISISGIKKWISKRKPVKDEDSDWEYGFRQGLFTGAKAMCDGKMNDK